MINKNLILKTCTKNTFFKTAGLFFITIISNPTSMLAQGDPSLDNIKKATEAAREQLRHEEIMSYVYMVIGFMVVITVAWFANVRVQKRRDLASAAKKSSAMHHRNPHDPHRRVVSTGFKKKLHKQVTN